MRRTGPALALLLLVGCATTAPPPAGPPQRRDGALLSEGLPELPAALVADVARYQERGSATFLDWTADGALLVALRDGTASRLHLVAAPGAAPQPLADADAPVDDARWNPDPARPGLIFVRDADGDERFQLHHYDARRATLRMLGAGGSRDSDPLWSNRGDRYAFSSNRRDGINTEVWIGALDGAEPALALRSAGAWRALDWRGDDGALLVQELVSVGESRLYLLELASGALRQLLPSERPVAYGEAAFAPDDRGLLFVADDGGEFRALRHLDLASGALRTLSGPLPWDVEGFRLSPDGRWLAWSANQDGASRLHLHDLRADRAHPGPTLPEGAITGFGFSRDSRQLGLSLATGAAPSDAWSWSLAGGALRRWTASRLAGVAPALLVAPRTVRYPTFDAIDGAPRQIPALVYAPPGAGPAPVLVLLHGGPEAQSRPSYSGLVQYLVAELGCAVVLPNVRGSTGYGRGFVALDDRQRREDAVADVGALLAWLATQPGFDAARVAVAGGSYGGYLALAALARYPERLVGGVDVAGITDFVSFLVNTELGRRAQRREEYGDERDPFMRAILERISPLRHAQRIVDPVLVVQGRNDPRVPVGESAALVTKLRARGGTVWYLLADDEGHGFRKPANVAVQNAATVAFLREAFGLSDAATTPR